MPPTPTNPADNSTGKKKELDEIVDEVGVYNSDAYHFVQEGLSFTVQSVHGEGGDPKTGRHISGQQLCEGLRDYALARWGLMAPAVLKSWGVCATMDFGRIVFALIENGILQKTDADTIDDFRNVYDFRTAFDQKYRIPSKTP
jgi:uncharacterized repeat protein (TIGR04138 family)